MLVRMERAIQGFRRDEQGLWVAELGCGHTQHVRHQPPWQERPWVLTEAGRAAMIGTRLDCTYCEMAALPAGLTTYKRTSSFSDSSVPEAL